LLVVRLVETKTMEPPDVIIVEGILLLYKKKIRDLLDMKVRGYAMKVGRV
jgi:uridine kinase